MESNRSIPFVRVGIVTADEIKANLTGVYSDLKTNRQITGTIIITPGDELTLVPQQPAACSFTIFDVIIGIGFHWQKKEDQVFRGGVRSFTKDGKVTLVNEISVEEYLESVISSEMNAASPAELLKAHAVISRSWLLAQIDKGKTIQKNKKNYQTIFRSKDEIVAWYDREDHEGFDVCADDHCQRYQGITKSSKPEVLQAVKQTQGEVMMYKGQICDTRFSKCCGGITELFENVWEPVHHDYLLGIADHNNQRIVTVANELSAVNWIMSKPDAFCNTTDSRILSQVLNDYDQSTHDFYRWTVQYSNKNLVSVLHKKTGIDFGTIIDMIPLQRGVSGRITRLKIIGTAKEFIIGKELEIRKALSETHLYSSAFVVEKKVEPDEVTFILHGAGWGHGVGLCQIGAAVMANKGYTYNDILTHYFRGADKIRKY